MRKLLFLLVLLFPMAVMAQFKYIPLKQAYTNIKVSKKEIPVYLEKTDAPKNIEEIGLISCDGFSDTKRFRKAKKMAAKHGATGIYIVTEKEETERIKAALGRRRAHETRFVAFIVKE